LQQDQPTRGYQPYTIQIVLPKGTEKISHEQLERAVIRDVFSHHGIYTSRAAIEDFLKTHGTIDLNEQLYRNQQGETVATRDRVRGIMPEAREMTDKVTGKTQRGYELTITGEFQSAVLGAKEKAEAVTKAGIKVVPELSMNERMSKAMQIAYDKHLPHTVGEAVKDVNPKQLMVGVAVAGSIVAVATKAGAAKAIPLIGAGVTLAQVSSYYAESEAFLKMCAEAKTEADLDKAAQQFASIVKQGGLDVGLTLATAGIGKFSAVSGAGGKLVDDVARIANDTTRATLGKFKQWNDEIVAGMKQAYGEDLVFENVLGRVTTNTKNIDEIVNSPMEARAAKAENTGARRDIEMQEAAGGHTIERHVGKSESWLRKRIETDPTLRIDGVASSFRNETIANRTQGQFIKQNKQAIIDWLKGESNRPFTDVVKMKEPIGIVVERSKSGFVETTKARIVLVKDNSEHGWHILTSFPITR
jgi:hypothetical protein